jgi:hypothetical protein
MWFMLKVSTSLAYVDDHYPEKKSPKLHKYYNSSGDGILSKQTI